MAANGRIPTKSLAALPKVLSNKRETERLTKNAYASLVRMMLRAVADTGSYFSIWDAYRSMAEQVEMLKRNYTKVSRARSKSSDRSYGGSTWAKKSGRPLTASPGYSNHGGPTPGSWTRGLFTLRARVYRCRCVRRCSGTGSGTRSGGAWCCSGSASGTSCGGR